jgi:hypothetical protein
MLPSPSGVAIENADAACKNVTHFGGGGKGKCFVGVRNRNVPTDDGCDLVVGDPSCKVKNGARKIGI